MHVRGITHEARAAPADERRRMCGAGSIPRGAGVPSAAKAFPPDKLCEAERHSVCSDNGLTHALSFVDSSTVPSCRPAFLLFSMAPYGSRSTAICCPPTACFMPHVFMCSSHILLLCLPCRLLPPCRLLNLSMFTSAACAKPVSCTSHVPECATNHASKGSRAPASQPHRPSCHRKCICPCPAKMAPPAGHRQLSRLPRRPAGCGRTRSLRRA